MVQIEEKEDVDHFKEEVVSQNQPELVFPFAQSFTTCYTELNMLYKRVISYNNSKTW